MTQANLFHYCILLLAPALVVSGMRHNLRSNKRDTSIGGPTDLECVDLNLRRTLIWKSRNVSANLVLEKYDIYYGLSDGLFLPTFDTLTCYRDENRTIKLSNVDTTECKMSTQNLLPYNNFEFRVEAVYRVLGKKEYKTSKYSEIFCESLETTTMLSAPVVDVQRTTTAIRVFVDLPAAFNNEIKSLHNWDWDISYYFCLFEEGKFCIQPYRHCTPSYENATLRPSTNYTVQSWYKMLGAKNIESDRTITHTKTLDDPFPPEAQISLVLSLFGLFVLVAITFALVQIFRKMIKKPNELLKKPMPKIWKTTKQDLEKFKESGSLLCCCNWTLLQQRDNKKNDCNIPKIVVGKSGEIKTSSTRDWQDESRKSVYENIDSRSETIERITDISSSKSAQNGSIPAQAKRGFNFTRSFDNSPKSNEKMTPPLSNTYLITGFSSSSLKDFGDNIPIMGFASTNSQNIFAEPRGCATLDTPSAPLESNGDITSFRCPESQISHSDDQIHEPTADGIPCYILSEIPISNGVVMTGSSSSQALHKSVFSEPFENITNKNLSIRSSKKKQPRNNIKPTVPVDTVKAGVQNVDPKPIYKGFPEQFKAECIKMKKLSSNRPARSQPIGRESTSSDSDNTMDSDSSTIILIQQSDNDEYVAKKT